MKTIPGYTPVKDPKATKAIEDLRVYLKGLTHPTAGAKVVSVSFTAPDTDTALKHGLGKRATRYILVKSSAATVLYDGADPTEDYDPNVLWLRASATADCEVMVF